MFKRAYKISKCLMFRKGVIVTKNLRFLFRFVKLRLEIFGNTALKNKIKLKLRNRKKK